MRKQLEALYASTKVWLKSLLVPLLFGLLLGTADVARQPFAKIYPDRDSVGGVAFPLAWVTGGQDQPSRLEFVLVRQSLKPVTKFEFVRRGEPIEMSGVYAGVAADRMGTVTSLTGGLNGMRYLSLDLPEKTLGGTTIAIRVAPHQAAKYVVTVGEVTKDLADPDDLIIQTKNEARRTAILYLFMALTLSIVSFYVARAQPLKHPADKSPEDAHWV